MRKNVLPWITLFVEPFGHSKNGEVRRIYVGHLRPVDRCRNTCFQRIARRVWPGKRFASTIHFVVEEDLVCAFADTPFHGDVVWMLGDQMLADILGDLS